MTRSERRAAASLAAIFGLRMLGMFLILPVFALYAQDLPGGDDHALVGLALGMYGLTQALFMLPFGMASDRWGRKPVIIAGLLLFALGSFVAAAADDIYMVILGRALQGAGAISAAVTALLADLTREEKRTQAMAMVGSTIGLAFALSLAAGPLFYRWIGVPGIFAMTGVLALLAIVVVKFVTPNPGLTVFHSDAQTNPRRLGDVLRDGELLRLDFGIFALHAAQMAMFLIVPLALSDAGGLPADAHWQVYLPVLLGSFVFLVPAVIYGEKYGRMKPVFVSAIGLMFLAQLGFSLFIGHFWAVVATLLAYFVAFNILEATLPSLVSKVAPAEAKGTAMGVYNTAQALGLFFGGAVGGWLAKGWGQSAVFVFCAALIGVWLVLAKGMRPPLRVKTQMFHVGHLEAAAVQQLAARLSVFAGVESVTVLVDEGVVMLKVSQLGWDEEGVKHVLQGGE
ncbi:putative MFS family arabinose efflux permease [Sulfuritortus calidifontis]|uniref:Putative MFS family arabinose efflux permease n=2 Tax=Sulfuritortus calidifontis TaxID=1914471 RepID=A0A4R3JZ90_9PROT|nr:MFS transporter [Sulfuritortus calidifontis]TCS74095.1 putative MFS family arabinose efflux permease [Sulfuritortus calidifontis]